MDYYARLYEMSEYYDFMSVKNETLPFADESKHRTWKSENLSYIKFLFPFICIKPISNKEAFEKF